MNLRQRFIDTGLFSETDTRDLVTETHEVIYRGTDDEIQQHIRVRLSFDPFGELTGVEAYEYDPYAAKIVADNRKAIGMPPQHSKA